MIKSSSRRAAVVLSGSAIALTAAMLPAQAATSSWRINTELHTRGNINVVFGVDAVSARDAWATGVTANNKTGSFKSVLRHWTGNGWHPVTLPAGLAKRWNSGTPLFTQIAASRAGDVWVFNGFLRGAYLHRNGNRWSTGRLPGGGGIAGPSLDITAARDFGKDNAWAFGGKVSLASPTPKPIPYAAHFNGSKWTAQTLPGKGEITAVSADSASSMWAVVGSSSGLTSPVGVSGGPLVLHWTAKAGWQRAAVQPVLPAGANLTSVVAEPDGTVWIGGSVKNSARGTTAFVASWTTAASAWTLARLGAASAGKWGLTDMAPDGRGGIFGVAAAINVKGEPERMWHLSGTTWSRTTPRFGKHEWILTQLAAVPGTASVWGVGALKASKSEDGLIAIDGPTPR